MARRRRPRFTIVLQLLLMNPNWQRANIQAAASYLREVMARAPADGRARVVYEGLLDVLDPARRTARLQRERAATAAAVPVQAARERRARHERRLTDRRKANAGSPTGVERRATVRRTGRDRRSRSSG
jgi:hypothetical protein